MESPLKDSNFEEKGKLINFNFHTCSLDDKTLNSPGPTAIFKNFNKTPCDLKFKEESLEKNMPRYLLKLFNKQVVSLFNNNRNFKKWIYNLISNEKKPTSKVF